MYANNVTHKPLFGKQESQQSLQESIQNPNVMSMQIQNCELLTMTLW